MIPNFYESDKTHISMIEHLLKTYFPSKNRFVPFNLFPRQKELCETLSKSNLITINKSRQMGVSSVCAAFIASELCLADPESPETILIIAPTLKLGGETFKKIKEFLLQFPLWLWGIFENSGYDLFSPPEKESVIFEKCNSKELSLKNGCKVLVCSDDPNASRGLGGVTWLVLEESALIKPDVYISALPTVVTGGHVVMISTPIPDEKDELHYETCRRAGLKDTEDWNDYELFEMKWYQDPRYNKFLEWRNADKKVIKETYLDLDGNIEYNPERWDKLINDGYKPHSPWYERMCNCYGYNEEMIATQVDALFHREKLFIIKDF